MASSADIPYGSVAHVVARFTVPDANGNPQPVDPSGAVTFKFNDPAGAVTTWTVQVNQIVKDSVGVYHADVDSTLVGVAGGPGVWKGRFFGAGTNQGSKDFEWLVDDSPLK